MELETKVRMEGLTLTVDNVEASIEYPSAFCLGPKQKKKAQKK